MRLIDLSPHWVSFANASDGVRFYFGVSFLCPHCDHTDCPLCHTKRGKRLAVSFWPPIDPDNWEERITKIPHDNFHERISGETFDTLTLKPSVVIKDHFHGSIINGEIV
jgi:hypothetical protein